ncbi:hypothetical protein JYU34_012846 [Plutella xylostella]|uniref:Uncharacterized protein n=1 Tax=Plutella xylostella TaxID=51655 RepID=A0ABQ7QCA1_PLUXY|nr:hypothetical protein JYU34_012846 [Plutella xylostella]
MQQYWVVYFLCLLVGCRAEPVEEAAMVTDVIHAMERPSSVIATLCWSLSQY